MYLQRREPFLGKDRPIIKNNSHSFIAIAQVAFVLAVEMKKERSVWKKFFSPFLGKYTSFLLFYPTLTLADPRNIDIVVENASELVKNEVYDGNTSLVQVVTALKLTHDTKLGIPTIHKKLKKSGSISRENTQTS